MNITLLGNGFDLYYHLPTKYYNFLHTVCFLINNYSENIKFVGDVFSDSELQKIDEYIAESYEIYKEAYYDTALDINKMKKLIDCAKNNAWFKYLLKSFDKDTGWIDFEKEISVVIKAFADVLSKIDIGFSEDIFGKNALNSYIIKNFDFFYTERREATTLYGMKLPAYYSVNKEFIIEYPIGSNIKKVNAEKIINFLAGSLAELANALKLYLHCFVENVLDNTSVKKQLTCHKALKHSDFVVTLNYTNVFEKLYSYDQIFHLHGNVKDEIVLGVNSDCYDELEQLDVSFIAFKKYYQRTMLETDHEYLRWCDETLTQPFPNIHVLVMGHSIDITDKDVIEDLFGVAAKITILYHSQEAKSSYIANLIKIFGKSHFYTLREERNLSFLPIDMDFVEFEQEQAENSLKSYRRASESFGLNKEERAII